MINEDLIDAFTAFNDAAVAINCCQLPQATAAADRLEKARVKFQGLFMTALKDDALAARDAGNLGASHGDSATKPKADQ
jgi:hypothetical protein